MSEPNKAKDISPVSFIKVNQIHPSPVKPIRESEAPKPATPTCFCSSLWITMFVCKLIGMMPICSSHDANNKCVFKKSYLWLLYSILLISGHIGKLVLGTDIMEFDTSRPLREVLYDINNIIYLIFATGLTTLNMIKYPMFIRAFNKLRPLVEEPGLLCNSALMTFKNIQGGYVIILMLVMGIEFGVLFWLHESESYETHFDLNFIISRTIYYFPFVFYLLFFSTCSCFICILACYEKLVISALHFRPVHPLPEIDETNNTHHFVGMFSYKVCKEEHKCSEKMLKMTPSELLEYLRFFHEDLSQLMYELNSCMNPQLLFHTTVELAVLIVHWYEVVMYITYEKATPYTSTINFLNWVFALSHSIGLFLFMKNAQELKNMISSLKNFLLEYSTRTCNPEEHQQIRIFMEKLELHRPITANNIFSIDLGIAAPISANILTYVLVALQFEVPKYE